MVGGPLGLLCGGGRVWSCIAISFTAVVQPFKVYVVSHGCVCSRSDKYTPAELLDMKAEEKAAREGNIRWQDRGPPGQPGVYRN